MPKPNVSYFALQNCSDLEYNFDIDHAFGSFAASVMGWDFVPLKFIVLISGAYMKGKKMLNIRMTRRHGLYQVSCAKLEN